MIHLPWFTPHQLYLHRIAGDESAQYRFLCVAQQGKKTLVKEGGETTDVKDLRAKAKLRPIVLCVEGRGILTREYEGTDLGSDEVVTSILPNANPAEFTCQVYRDESTQKIHVSIIRIQILDQILQELREQEITVETILLGHVFHARPPVHETAMQPAGVAYTQPFEYLHAIVHALQGGSWKFSFVASPAASLHRDETGYFRRTKKLLLIAPAALLVLLVANLFYYGYIESGYVATQQTLELNHNELDSITLLEGMLRERQHVLGQQGNEASIPASHYADELASLLTEDITLDKVDIFPVVLDEETMKVRTMRTDTILVEGVSRNSDALNRWVRRMTSAGWVDAIHIVNYSQPNANDPGDFELMISCR